MNHQIFSLAIAALLSLAASATFSEESPDFARHVLPILSDKCFVCHGPDAKKDQLRLDSFAAASADLGGYRAIDPKNPHASELIARIDHPSDPMPPKKADKKLTRQERETLRQWVQSGGAYSKHWAFVPPKNPEGPEDTIDSFVEKKLEGIDLAPAKPADKPTLARRAALIVTGLPPEPSQLRRFLSDSSPAAYEILIDDLITSPRFGEHQARYWLDAVRYGDTHGLHLDNRRGIFPYRDWVIRAFNNNLPFDEFITWQLAGDLFPSPTLEQLVATGYVRMNPTTSEGGAIPAEFQAKNNFDRTENLGSVFLGMTLNCARCHSHKYDPVTQREYYEMLAFFNSTAEAPLDGNAYQYPPVVEAPSSQSGWNHWKVLAEQRNRLVAKTGQYLAKNPTAAARAWQQAKLTLKWTTKNWRMSKAVSIDQPKPSDEESWKNLADSAALSRERFGNAGTANWIAFSVTLPQAQTLLCKVQAGPGSELSISDEPGQPAAKLSLIRRDAGAHTLTAKLAGIDRRTKLSVQLINPWESFARNGKWNSADSLDRVLMAGDPNLSVFPKEIQKEAAQLGEKLVAARAGFTTSLIAGDLPKPRETRLLDRGEYDRPVGDPLAPGVFAAMNPFPENAPKNRLGLAQWLTSPDHPLTGRVLVNRFWQSVFGDGLVRTPEDFGLQGKYPTHPRLLDWLTRQFIDKGWNYKTLVKTMVMSRTFQQDSAWRDDLIDPDNLNLARGPGFRLDAEVIRDTGLWVAGLLQPAMGGEGVKPWQPEGMWEALAHPASNTKLYVPDLDNRINRRSIYVYWKRTSPHPMMTLFDAPNRESSCVRRSRGNTPLQSLGLLNEPQRVSMARAAARRLVRSAKSDRDRLDLIFGLVSCRPPNEAEIRSCLELLEKARTRYASHPEDAEALLSSGRESGLLGDNLAETAAWAQVTSTVLASDTAILLY